MISFLAWNDIVKFKLFVYDKGTAPLSFYYINCLLCIKINYRFMEFSCWGFMMVIVGSCGKVFELISYFCDGMMDSNLKGLEKVDGG